MKMQKEMRKFCPRCKTHTVQAVALYKKGKDRRVAEGARRHAEDKKGYGGQKFPELKRTAKTTSGPVMTGGDSWMCSATWWSTRDCP